MSFECESSEFLHFLMFTLLKPKVESPIVVCHIQESLRLYEHYAHFITSKTVHMCTKNQHENEILRRRRKFWCFEALNTVRAAHHAATRTPGARRSRATRRGNQRTIERSCGRWLHVRRAEARVNRLVAEVARDGDGVLHHPIEHVVPLPRPLVVQLPLLPLLGVVCACRRVCASTESAARRTTVATVTHLNMKFTYGILNVNIVFPVEFTFHYTQ